MLSSTTPWVTIGFPFASDVVGPRQPSRHNLGDVFHSDQNKEGPEGREGQGDLGIYGGEEHAIY